VVLTLNIYELCKELKLSFIKENYQSILEDTSKSEPSYSEFLLSLLESEYLNRIDNSVKRRLRTAKFPEVMYLKDFNKSFYDAQFSNTAAQLETLEFINKKNNLILIGASGAGKTFYATALGVLACHKGKNVLFISVADLILEIRERMSQNQITNFKNKFNSFDLVIIDELGYFSFDRDTAELFFNILASRNKKGSIIITSNLPFDEWQVPLGDPKITSALVGRLCQDGYVIELEREIDGRLHAAMTRHKS
jgi:DNA replication protein DnaC